MQSKTLQDKFSSSSPPLIKNCQFEEVFYECFNGAFIDGFENDRIPFDEYKVVKNCNCIITTNKKICKNYNVSVTEYLTATYIYAMYLSIYERNSKEEIIISVPIDLRKYYQVNTLFNFFVCMNINSKIVEKSLTTFDEILKQVHVEFQDKLNVKEVSNYLASAVKLGTNIFIHIIPLVIKKYL